MSELKQVMRFVWMEKKDTLLSVAFGFLAGMTAIGLFAANGFLMSKAALQPPFYVLMVMVAVVKMGSITRAVSRYAERYYSHRATFTILSHIRVYFYEKLEQQAPKLFASYRSGDLLARIVGDVETLQNFYLRVLYPPILMLFVFVSTIMFVTYFSMAVVVLLTIGLLLTGFVIPAWFATVQRKVGSNIREQRGTLSTEATEWFHGFRELKIHQHVQQKEEQLLAASTSYVHEQERSNVGEIFSSSLNMAVALVIAWAVLAVGAYSVSSGTLDGVFLAMLVMIALLVFDQSTPMAAFSIHYEDSKHAAKRLYSVVGEKDEDEGEDKSGGVVKVQSKSTGLTETMEANESTGCLNRNHAHSVTFNHVNFAYPDQERLTLRDINLHLPSGSKTAIVGPSGSGKSTLLQLILQLQDEYKGSIVIDGEHSLGSIHPEDIWQQANVVLQHNHFFYGTVRDNLLLEPGAMSDDELHQLLQEVQLPQLSLDDDVMEKGENLSGGEKQRLAMARAVAKANSNQSRLWLLDEPTSSLDRATERKLYDLLNHHAKDDTILLISHRLTNLDQMDQIVVMEEGQIVEKGTYEELIEQKGYLYQMKQIEQSVYV